MGCDGVTCSGGTFTQFDERPLPPCCRHGTRRSAIAALADHPTDRRVPSGVRGVRIRLGAGASPAIPWLLGLLLLWLLAGPRIDLPALRGLRVEDLVFLAMAVLCLARARRIRLPRGVTLGIIAVVVAGLISALVATARGMVDPVQAVLFALRPAEYWIAFPAALLVLRSPGRSWRKRVEAMLAVVTVLQTVFAILQYYFGFQVGFSHAAYSRAAGLTVGPYELGAISAALVVFWVARGRWTLASLSAIALAASISRISLLGAAAGLGLLALASSIRFIRSLRRSGVRAALALGERSLPIIVGHVASVVAATIVLAFTLGLIQLPATTSSEAAGPEPAASASNPGTESTAAPAPTSASTTTPGPAPQGGDGAGGPAGPSDSISERLATTSVLGSWNLGGRLAAVVPPVRTSGQYADVAYTRLNQFVDLNTAAQNGAEASNLVRFFRWHLILDTIDDPTDVLLGLGPSFVGPSVDGSYLRMLAEGGVLGLVAWGLLVVMWLRRAPLWMVCITISVLVGGLFIDIVYAERPMVLFWILLAIATTTPRRGSAEVHAPA